MKFLLPLILCLLVIGCDGGLAPPPPVELGFSGTVHFAPGYWPPSDSIYSLWIFASQVYPLDSIKVLTGLFGNPMTIFLYPSINQSLSRDQVDSLAYSFPLKAGTYKYVGVIQQVSPSLTNIRAFRVVGFYKDSIDASQPGIVEVNDSYQTRGVDMDVDFQNPPPQPF
jgi:hypothetical protein